MQMEGTSIYAELRKRVGNGMTPEKAVDTLLRVVPKATLAEFVRPLLVKEARRYIRFDVLKVEQQVRVDTLGGKDPVQARRDLLDLEFWVNPQVRWVKFRFSTVEHHELRAEFQEKHAKSCLEDAQFHREIARDMLTAGVNTFEQLTMGVRSKHLRKAKTLEDARLKKEAEA